MAQICMLLNAHVVDDLRLKSVITKLISSTFTILFGNPPENFYLLFEEYREKMFAKYGVSDYGFIVPIEEKVLVFKDN